MPLLSWFSYLDQFRSACNTPSVLGLNRLQFANSTITAILRSSIEQNQFLVTLTQNYHFDFSLSDLTTYPTFKDLLNHKDPLVGTVADILQSFAVAPFPTGSSQVFWNTQVSQAFPGGSAGAGWQTANTQLIAVMDKDCYSAGQQTQVAKLIDGNGNKISDVSKQIGVLG